MRNLENRSSDQAIETSKQWFKEAKQGLFIHWGLYSILAGEWKGRQIPWLGEWIMHSAKIPVGEYETLAKEFNPTKFNAKEWVKSAEDAGMKYLILTAKHHEGFAMYHSGADKFNITDASPFRRDPIAELSEACKGTQVKLGLYYSQVMDWHEPHGGNSRIDMNYGNNWDFPYGTPEGFKEYLSRKVFPQTKELLTQYGPVAMMWFDNPLPSFTLEHALELKNLVRKLQPGCLINARIGHGIGDIRGLGDNCLPSVKSNEPMEACITMNETWGYKKQGGGTWKSPEQIRSIVQQTNARDCNVLLNVGPTASGQFPSEAHEILSKLT